MSSKQETGPVDSFYRNLVEQGGEDTHSDFDISKHFKQHDLVINGKRILVTPDNQSYRDYEKAMTDADVDYLKQPADCEPDKDVAVVEIPRDARNLAQVAVTAASREGDQIDSSYVFEKFGKTIRDLSDITGLVPKEKTLSLRRVLYSRINDSVILVPGIEFTEASESQMNRLYESIFDQLDSARAFGSAALLNSFMDGASNGSD